MKYTVPKIVILSALLYCLLLADKFIGLGFPSFAKSHLADLLCMPLLLFISVKAIRFTMKPTFTLSPMMIVLSTAYVAFVFEFLLPRWSPRFTPDLLDILAYSVGAGWYYLRQQQWLSPPQEAVLKN